MRARHAFAFSASQQFLVVGTYVYMYREVSSFLKLQTSSGVRRHRARTTGRAETT